MYITLGTHAVPGLHIYSAVLLRKKGNVHPVTDHEGPEGEYRYSSTLPSTSALDGMCGQRHAPAA
jgi:hypothetical protein